jgi:hypothetical protein
MYIRVCLCFVLATTSLAACVHKGAVKVYCDGPLQPINRPTAPDQAPVTIRPIEHEAARESQP